MFEAVFVPRTGIELFKYPRKEINPTSDPVCINLHQTIQTMRTGKREKFYSTYEILSRIALVVKKNTYISIAILEQLHHHIHRYIH